MHCWATVRCHISRSAFVSLQAVENALAVSLTALYKTTVKYPQK